MKTKQPTYLITVRPLPDETDPDGIRRLRRLLKAMVRSWRLQCVAIVPAEPAKEQDSKQAAKP